MVPVAVGSNPIIHPDEAPLSHKLNGVFCGSEPRLAIPEMLGELTLESVGERAKCRWHKPPRVAASAETPGSSATLARQSPLSACSNSRVNRTL